ncbi:HET-domain-containing protein, partial [Dissoconium aciculare CBS 342.82]|uniref:HET-domain-containing protein n=1 Tax=Dissoconium aciculare CBS 342.82 TaxID=1314786 RepID=A0A6J3LT11_9PEZI
QFWSRYCLLNHQNCRPTAQTQVALPTRLLSISEDAVRLIHTSDWAEPLPYATLSHCWGDTKFLCLNSANLHTLASGIHWDDLANTFKDAIEIARRARLNHIWIDSLCIVQDSRSDWQLESAKMGMIYRGSSLNIAAASATDGTQGCLPRKPSSRSISTFRTAHAGDDTLLRNTWASESYDLHQNHLETRAWCMQELILAPRTLYCTNKGLFWECKSRLATEDLQTLDHLLPALPDVRAITTVESWMRRIVVPYSKCSLTFSTDKLPALDGLARIIQPNIGSDYLAGLWRSHMVLQLCWFAKTSETRPLYRGAPSWSWASVDGPVDLYPRLDQQDIKPAESSFVTLVHDVVTEMAHSNAFGELKMGRMRINCSKLV